MTQPAMHDRSNTVTTIAGSGPAVPTDVVMGAVPTLFGFRLVAWHDMTDPERAAYRTFVREHALPSVVRKRGGKLRK